MKITTKFYTITIGGLMILMVCCKSEIGNLEVKNISEHWEISKTTFDGKIDYRDMFFINDQVGFIVGFNGGIYKTLNSGATWQKQNSGTTLHLYSVFFLNDTTGYVGGQAMGCLDDDCNKGSVFLKTTNGGETWTKTFFENYVEIYSVHFFDKLVGLAIITLPDDVPNTRNTFVSKTYDGGNSWKLIDLPIEYYSSNFQCINNVVYIIGENQQVFKSKDYGDTWEAQTLAQAAGLRSLYFIDENVGYVNSAGIYKTTNGGLSWDGVNYPFSSSSSFNLFHFYDAAEGFNIETIFDRPVYDESATFKGSFGYMTINGGKTWSKSELQDSLFITLTHFPRSGLGYGIGPNGTFKSAFYTIKRK